MITVKIKFEVEEYDEIFGARNITQKPSKQHMLFRKKKGRAQTSKGRSGVITRPLNTKAFVWILWLTSSWPKTLRLLGIVKRPIMAGPIH